jgi:hypothetical protein
MADILREVGRMTGKDAMARLLCCEVLLLLSLQAPQDSIGANASIEMAQGPDRSLRRRRKAQSLQID